MVAEEVIDADRRRHVVTQAWRVQPWYAGQRSSIDEWVSGSPFVTLTPTGAAGAEGRAPTSVRG